MQKHKTMTTILFLLCILLSGCNKVQETSEQTSNPAIDFSPYQSAVTTADIFSNADDYNGVINGRPIFSIAENGKDWVIYEYDTEKNKEERTAVIEDFRLNMRYAVIDDDYWYSFIVLGDEPEPQLCRVNTETSEVSIITRTLDTQSEFSLCKCNGKLVTLSKKTENGVQHEYVETYNPKTDCWDQIKEFSHSEETLEGDNPLGLCSNGNNIFVFLEKNNPNTGKVAEVQIINDIGEIIESATVPNDIYTYISQSFFFDMQMFGNYIYILSSTHCLVGIIEDGELKDILKEDNMEVAFGYQGNSPIFFKRDSCYLYELNSDSRVTEYYIPIEEDKYSILCVVADEEKCYIVCVDYETGKRKGYMFNRKDLGNVYLPVN